MSADVILLVECHLDLKYESEKIISLKDYVCVNYTGFNSNSISLLDSVKNQKIKSDINSQ